MTRTHRPLTLAQQAYALRGTGHGSTRLKLDHLRSTVELQPTPLSRSYECELRYRLGYPPEVRVLQPMLQRNTDGALPHYFYETLPLRRRGVDSINVACEHRHSLGDRVAPLLRALGCNRNVARKRNRPSAAPTDDSERCRQHLFASGPLRPGQALKAWPVHTRSPCCGSCQRSGELHRRAGRR